MYHQRIGYFPVIDVESLECMFLKKEGMKKERGVDTPFHTMAIVCQSGCDVMNFEVNLIFLVKPFFLHHPRVVTKT